MKKELKLSEGKSFAILRIVFGFIWLINASFKWNPTFLNNFTSYLIDGVHGQPAFVQIWVGFWIHIVSVNPHFFGIFIAIVETALALALIFGWFTKLAIAGGIALAFIIWSTVEGFGGPYVAGSTDIGTSIIYIIVFVALYLGKSWQYYSIDNFFHKRRTKVIDNV